MQNIQWAARRVPRLQVVLATAVLLAVIAPAGAAGAAPTPDSASSATPTAAPVLPIGLKLGGISLSVTVPLTLGGLLSGTASSPSAYCPAAAPSY